MPELRLEQLACNRLAAADMTIDAGQCVCLSGASGSGKSSLLRAIADLDPHQGRVWLDGHEQSAIVAPQWRSWVGMLAAESVWWFDRVEPHFPSVELQWFEALGFKSNVLDWQVSRLSSGERQRLALLRLLCRKPKVLLLDEPTANLDAESGRCVEQLIREYRLANLAPVLWVSHSAEQIERVAQHHYKIESGNLVAQEINT